MRKPNLNTLIIIQGNQDLTRSSEIFQDLLRPHKIYCFDIYIGIRHLSFDCWLLSFILCHLSFANGIFGNVIITVNYRKRDPKCCRYMVTTDKIWIIYWYLPRYHKISQDLPSFIFRSYLDPLTFWQFDMWQLAIWHFDLGIMLTFLHKTFDIWHWQCWSFWFWHLTLT